jgi:hypothetical protein
MTLILGGDPGKHRDSFALVAIEPIKDKIHVRGANRFNKRDYLDVEKHIERSYKKNDFDHIVIELNNTGTHVVENLIRINNIPCIIPVTTSKNLKDMKKIFSSKVMDKNEMTEWMIRMFQADNILFPKDTDPNILELKRQLSIFAQHKTNAGNVSYYAEGSEHDDMVMALMLACFIGRYYLREKHVRGSQSTLSIHSKKFTQRDDDELLGTGAPKKYQVISKSVYYP